MKRSPVDSRYTRDFSSIMDGAVIHHMRRALRRERIFKDRQKPLDIYTDDQGPVVRRRVNSNTRLR